MDNEQLNDHLINLGDRATAAHEILRGVTDALAVIGQSTVRAASDDLASVPDTEEWRKEAATAVEHSETLMREAATLLRRTADQIDESTST